MIVRARAFPCLATLLLLACTAKAQTMTEFAVGGSPWGIAAGPDGNVWFTEVDGRIGRMTTGGTLTAFPIPSGAAPSGITTGPDFNLWFIATTVSDTRICRITPSGTITETVIGTLAGVGSGFICTGADGNLWFTESSGNRIGRFTTSGVLTEFPIPTASSQPWGITAGPDGNIWFTEPGSSRVGRITMAGVISEFDVTYAPFGITAGPDGALWFTATLGSLGEIGRITTSGVTSAFSWPGELRSSIVAGTDGALWFPAGQVIGSMSVGGASLTFPIPTMSSAPLDIALGPDHNLWFTETNVGRNKVGRLSAPVRTSLHTLTPCRVLDTRGPAGPLGGPSLAAFATRTFAAFGICALPTTAKALVANVTVTGATDPGYLAIGPGGPTGPELSFLNFRAGQTRANSGVVSLAADGSGTLVILNGSAGTADVILDVSGYFQ